MISIRELKMKDMEYMFEWLQDKNVTSNFRFDSDKIVLEDVEKFIRNSWEDKENNHFAIVNERDLYLGTISLKHIDWTNYNAEYAISLRRKYWGTGVACEATNLILKYGFIELGLNKIYLNVSSNNVRAISFYKKMKFRYEGEFFQHIFKNGGYLDLQWYRITKKEYLEEQKCI